MVRFLTFSLLLLLLTNCQLKREEAITGKPTLYIIGDSTVKNGRGDGAEGQWGWGEPIQQYFDTTKINIKNLALGGSSSRSYRSKGLWDKVLRNLQPGDYVLLQFGHNDSDPINDSIRARGTINGIGADTRKINNLTTGEYETVHSYGWYIRHYVTEAKAKGAIPVVVVPIPRNEWKEGRVARNNESYGKWAKEIAEMEEVEFVDLNEKMASVMDTLGEAAVSENLFVEWDNTHTTAKGALLAASKVVEGLRELENCWLKDYLLDNPTINFPLKKKAFIIGDSTASEGDGKIVGWGHSLSVYLDTSRIEIINKASDGHSSRTYHYEGLWNDVLGQIGKGDFLLIQFGQNDGSSINGGKFRSSLPGVGNETQVVTRDDDQVETVHSYGWYLKTFIAEAKEKGAEVIVLSQIPGNKWKDGQVERATGSYGSWAAESAKAQGAFYINLNEEIALEYEAMGSEITKNFYSKDQLHTNAAGARLNALILSRKIKQLSKSALSGYVRIR